MLGKGWMRARGFWTPLDNSHFILLAEASCAVQRAPWILALMNAICRNIKNRSFATKISGRFVLCVSPAALRDEKRLQAHPPPPAIIRSLFLSPPLVVVPKIADLM